MKLQDVLAITAVGCALVATSLLVRREFVVESKPTSAEGRPVSETERIANLAPHWSGDRNARTTVVEFFDFQCPACRAFSFALDSLLLSRQGEVRIARHHYPLAIHPSARELALVGICLGDTPAFETYYHRVFANQGTFASEFGGSAFRLLGADDDTAEVRRCASANGAWEQLNRGIALGDSLRLPGTPSFIVNGRLFTGARGLMELEKLVDEVEQ